MAELVVLPVAELEALIRRAVADALAEVQASGPGPLLDLAGLAAVLDVSLPSLYRLRQCEGFPELRIGEAPRFVLADVLAWLSARSASARDAQPGGKTQ